MRQPTTRAFRGVRATGFSLVELLVVLAVISAILGAVVALFTLSGRIARVQTQVSDMQQSLRIAQYDMIRNVRMAGRGGLPRGRLPNGVAIAVRNDVPDSGPAARIAPSDATSPEAVQGSDVLTVRGVFSSPIYQINPAAGGLQLDGSPPTGGRIRVQNPGPSGVPQDLQPLIDAVQADLPEALLLVSPLGSALYAVVELDYDSGNTDISNASDVTLQFRITGGTHTDGYLALSPGGAFPSAMRGVSSLGILEEYRYYVRKEYQVPGDNTTELVPRMARARVYPGTDAPHAGARTNLELDISDNVLDMQVALGIDIDGDEAVAESDPRSSTDEWVFNSSDDDETNPTQVDSWNERAAGEPTQLYYLRLTTLARTGRRDIGYLAPPLGVVEDRDHGESTSPSDDAERVRRMYRRQRMLTVIDLRNVQ